MTMSRNRRIASFALGAAAVAAGTALASRRSHVADRESRILPPPLDDETLRCE